MHFGHSILLSERKVVAGANNPFQLVFDFVFCVRNIMLKNKLVIQLYATIHINNAWINIAVRICESVERVKSSKAAVESN